MEGIPANLIDRRYSHSSRDYRKYSFYPRTVIDWNALPEHVALSESITSFKNNLAN